MKKKLLMILLSLSMIICMMPAMVFAGSGVPTEVATAEALGTALASGGAIKLTEDITYESTTSIGIVGETTIDLNGHTLNINTTNAVRFSFKIGSSSTDKSQVLTIKDSSAGETGILNVNNAWTTNASYLFDVYGTLDIQGGTINQKASKANSNGIYLNTSGTFKMSGGKLNKGTSLGSGRTLSASSGTKIITGGVIEEYYAGTSPTGWSISGGYYTTAPTYEMLADGKVTKLVSEGAYSGKYEVVDGTLIGLVGTTVYTDMTSFAQAIGGSNITVEGKKMTLTGDVNVGSASANKVTFTSDVTIDLAGHNLTGSVKGNSVYMLYVNKEGKTVTITDSVGGGKVENSTNGYCYAIGVNKGNVVIDGAKLIAKTSGTNVTRGIDLKLAGAKATLKNGANILIDNGTKKASGYGAYLNTGAELSMDDSEIKVESSSNTYGIWANKETKISIGQNSTKTNKINVSSMTENATGCFANGVTGSGDILVKNCEITVSSDSATNKTTNYGIYKDKYDNTLDVQDNVNIIVSGNVASAYGIYSIGAESRGISGKNVKIKVNGNNSTNDAKRYGIYTNNTTDFVINPGTNVSIEVNTDGIETGTNYVYNAYSSASLVVSGGTFKGGTINGILASGGVFDADPSSVCAPGYMVQADTPSAGLWTVVPDTTERIKNVTKNTKYASIIDAVKAAKNGDELQLLTDVTAGNLILDIGNVTLDLNGKKLTLRQINLSGTTIITDKQATGYGDAGTLSTVIDEGEGETTLTKINYTITGKAAEQYFFQCGKINETYTSALHFYGVKSNITLDACDTIYYAIKALGTGYIDMKSIDGYYNEFNLTTNNSSATYLFSGIKPTATIEIKDGDYSVSSGTGTGGAYFFSTLNSNGIAKVNITGGRFKAQVLDGKKTLFCTTSTDAVNITGGYYAGYAGNTLVTADTYFENVQNLQGGQYSPVALTEGIEYDAGYRYEVKSVPVCKIGGTEYTSIQAAIDAANTGDTITLLMNCMAYELKLDKNVSIDGTSSNYKVSLSGNKQLSVSAGVDVPDAINTSNCGAYILHKNGEKTYFGAFAAESGSSLGAMNAYSSNTDEKVVLTKDYEALNYVSVTKDCLIDLNGFEISTRSQKFETMGIYKAATCTVIDSSADETGKIIGVLTGEAEATIYLNNKNCTFILKSGTVENTGIGPAIAAIGAGSVLQNCTITIDGGTVHAAKNFAICDNGQYTANNTININGGLIKSDEGVAIYHPSSGTLTLKGGEVQSDTAIYVRSGKVFVPEDSKVKVIATGAKSDHDPNYSGGAQVTGDALVITVTDYPGGNPTADIRGGCFKSANGLPVASYKCTGTSKDAISEFISGGHYSSKPIRDYIVVEKKDKIQKDAPNYIADGYNWTFGHVVSYVSNGGTEVADQILYSITYATRPTNPTKKGFEFAGWFKENGEQFLFDSEKISESITLYAHWKTASSDTGDVIVEKKENATITSTAVISKAAIPLSENEITELNKTSDNDVKAILDVEKVITPQSNTPVEDATLIQKEIKEEKLTHGVYLDITLVKAIYINGIKQTATETEIHETLEPVKITIVIPENLREKGRTYSILRCHDAEVKTLYTGKANSDWEITFETDKFSTYAIAYKDSGAKGVKTGDSNNLTLYVGLFALMLLGIAGYVFARRKAR